jgi:hypothetical protein
LDEILLFRRLLRRDMGPAKTTDSGTPNPQKAEINFINFLLNIKKSIIIIFFYLKKELWRHF